MFFEYYTPEIFILFETHTISYLLKYVNTGIPVSRKDFWLRFTFFKENMQQMLIC